MSSLRALQHLATGALFELDDYASFDSVLINSGPRILLLGAPFQSFSRLRLLCMLALCPSCPDSVKRVLFNDLIVFLEGNDANQSVFFGAQLDWPRMLTRFALVCTRSPRSNSLRDTSFDLVLHLFSIVLASKNVRSSVSPFDLIAHHLNSDSFHNDFISYTDAITQNLGLDSSSSSSALANAAAEAKVLNYSSWINHLGTVWAFELQCLLLAMLLTLSSGGNSVTFAHHVHCAEMLLFSRWHTGSSGDCAESVRDAALPARNSFYPCGLGFSSLPPVLASAVKCMLSLSSPQSLARYSIVPLPESASLASSSPQSFTHSLDSLPESSEQAFFSLSESEADIQQGESATAAATEVTDSWHVEDDFSTATELLAEGKAPTEPVYTTNETTSLDLHTRFRSNAQTLPQIVADDADSFQDPILEAVFNSRPPSESLLALLTQLLVASASCTNYTRIILRYLRLVLPQACFASLVPLITDCVIEAFTAAGSTCAQLGDKNARIAFLAITLLREAAESLDNAALRSESALCEHATSCIFKHWETDMVACVRSSSHSHSKVLSVSE
jgi:hypothetical protein